MNPTSEPVNDLAERFTLRSVEATDLELLTGWMNDPAVDRWWGLAGPAANTADHVAKVARSGHSLPYIGLLDGVPMSYWELYRADLDPLAEHYPSRPHDAGIHLLVGPPEYRGRGMGGALIGVVADRLLAADPTTERVLAEPDTGNLASVTAFGRAGFRRVDDLTLPDKRAALMVLERTLDLVGVGIGPFNLALAALADRVPGLRARFFDERPGWSWHPGLLLPDARLQVPFLADLVSLVDPTNPWSFLSYLREHDRLFPFYFAERFHMPRREYDRYCRWVVERLPSCRFDRRVTEVTWDGEAFVVTAGPETVRARNLVLGIGTAPRIPNCLADLPDSMLCHSGGYLERKEELLRAGDVTVIGSGQSGAEVLLDLLRDRDSARAGRTDGAGAGRLRWLTRSPAFAPMEYSKLGLQHFTPDYTRYFHRLPPEVRDRRVPEQWQLYKAISADTIEEIYDLLYERTVDGDDLEATLSPNVAVTSATVEDGRVRLECRQLEQDRSFTVVTDMVVAATGYAERPAEFLAGLGDLIEVDHAGRFRVDEEYRLWMDPRVDGGVYLQNAELHTHGVGAPDLGLGAYRAATILNHISESVFGRPIHRLPTRTSIIDFDPGRTPDRPDTTITTTTLEDADAAGDAHGHPNRDATGDASLRRDGATRREPASASGRLVGGIVAGAQPAAAGEDDR